MKKSILLLLVGILLMSCKNELREECIRQYYDAKLHYDSLYVEYSALQEQFFEISEKKNDSYEASLAYEEYMIKNDIMKMQLDSWLDIAIGHQNNAMLARKPFDRNYWRIYEKELKKQGRLK